MIEAKFFTVGTYLYKYNLTVLFVSPSKIAHDKFYIYCPPLLLNEIYAHVQSTLLLILFLDSNIYTIKYKMIPSQDPAEWQRGGFVRCLPTDVPN